MAIVQTVLQQCLSEGIDEQIVNDPLLLILEALVEVERLVSQKREQQWTAEQIVEVLCLQIDSRRLSPETAEILEVIQLSLHERISERMRERCTLNVLFFEMWWVCLIGGAVTLRLFGGVLDLFCCTLK